MTALNIFIMDDSAVLVTDTLGRFPDGNSYQMQKAHAIPHMRLALAVRGHFSLSISVARLLQAKTSDYDSAQAFLGVHLRALAAGEYHDVSERHAWANEWDIGAIGWSVSRDSPAGFVVSNHKKHGLAPWRLHDVPFIASTPFVPAAVEKAQHDPSGQMLGLVRAQRDHHPESVGGFAVATTVTRDLIVTEALGCLDEKR